MSTTPLLDGIEDARPALIGTAPLSARQQRQDESIRTLCLVILSTAVLGIGAYYLRTILVRFVLALALRYLLTPLIDSLSCHGLKCRFRLPRGLAILFALFFAGSLLGGLGLVVVNSVGSFATHANAYHERVEQLAEGVINATASLDLGLDLVPLASSNTTSLRKTLLELAKTQLSLSHLILGLLGSAAHVVENAIYILLFLAFMLAGSKPREPNLGDVHSAAEEQIFVYIRGKVAIAALVAMCDGLVLMALHVNLWLVFGVLTFWLNFVPNVGMALSVLLPMPIVLLDPQFGFLSALLAFFAPLGIGLVAKDILEPLLIGHSTSLTPVAVLLSVMLWGSIWGLTGMVLAVPMTAAFRIYLAGMIHPLPRWCALALAGRSEAPDTTLDKVTPRDD